MKNTRKGMGKGLGCGYKNIAPMDAHIHSLSAKGIKSLRYEVKIVKTSKPFRKTDDNYSTFDTQVELFKTLPEAKKFINDTYGKKFRQPMFQDDANGDIVKTGRIFSFSDKEYNRDTGKYDRYTEQDWVSINKVKKETFMFSKGKKTLNARGDMHTIQLDPEYSVITYADDTRNGFKHVAILMRNGQEVDKASVSYLNRTWESYSFQTVLHKLFDANFDKDKAQILKTDLDKVHGSSLMAKGKNMSDKAVKKRFKELDQEIDTMTGTSESDAQIKDTLQDVENEQLKLMIDHPITFGMNPEEKYGRVKYKALLKEAKIRGLDAKGLKELPMSEVKKTRGIMKEFQSYVTQPSVLPKGKKVLSHWVADAKKRKHLYLTYSDGTTVIMYPDGRRDWFNKKGKLTKTAMLGIVPIYPKNLKASGLLKGNKLKKRLQKLGFETDNTNWDKKSVNDDGERWEE